MHGRDADLYFEAFSQADRIQVAKQLGQMYRRIVESQPPDTPGTPRSTMRRYI